MEVGGQSIRGVGRRGLCVCAEGSNVGESVGKGLKSVQLVGSGDGDFS